MTDHEHVWVRTTPAMSFLLLDSDPKPYCSVCGIPATQCSFNVPTLHGVVRCTRIADHTGPHTSIPGER